MDMIYFISGMFTKEFKKASKPLKGETRGVKRCLETDCNIALLDERSGSTFNTERVEYKNYLDVDVIQYIVLILNHMILMKKLLNRFQ